MPTAFIILAAGKGTRMNSDLPKVLHPLGGAPMVLHAMQAASAMEAERTIVVAGHGADAVENVATTYDANAGIVVQREQLGTGHAVGMANSALRDFQGDVIVLYGDTPFVRTETLEKMLTARAEGNAVVVLGFETPEPAGYGRLVISENDKLEAIVEDKDAKGDQKDITFCNSGVICADARQLFELVGKIGNKNKSEEYYLTEIVGLANAGGLSCSAVSCDQAETLGVNSRADLAAAEATFQAKSRIEAIENGVMLSAPDTVFFAFDTMIGRDVVVGPNVIFGPGVTVESGAEIRAFCHLEGCHISRDAIIGPFARLRPGAEISEGARVGNFVEIKQALIGEGAKVNHLSYVGDAEVGEGANIGAGTITCNYDGVMKHRTTIGAGAFIGSNTALVAPVSVGRQAMTGSGSVITKDVPDEALGLARFEQTNKPGFATRLKSRLKAIKARKNKV